MYLNNHSYYSLRYGVLPVKELIDEAKRCGVRKLPLTDINNSTVMFDFVRLCLKNHIEPVSGIEFRNDDDLLYIGLAKNNEGFRELNEFLSDCRMAKKSIPASPPLFNNVYIIYPFGIKPPEKLRDNEFIGVRPMEINRLISNYSERNKRKWVVLSPVTFRGAMDFTVHKHLRAIAHNCLLSQLSHNQMASPDEIMMPENELKNIFQSYPPIIENTEQLIQDCSFSFDFKTMKNKKSFTGNMYEDKLLLEKLAYKGLYERYGKNNSQALQRLKKELDVIFKLGFCAYFLIGWDIIRYSISEGIYHVGRGSGANSIVSYCLKITDVDPIELNLYFERFINPKRSAPPDFDIDYSWKDRDKIHDYIFEKHGKQHTALLGAISTFQGKSILRELGKVYGLPKQEIDDFIKYPNKAENINSITKKILTVGNHLSDFPNLRSIHAGGVIISEKPITCYTALDLPPKGYPTTQWDMYIAEDIGFEKLDILSQRGIGHIKDAADLIYKNRGVSVDIHDIETFKTDEKTQKLLQSGETTGCFYVESPAMRGLLKKLHCENYKTLVAASSIIRPGVAKSGMMREYIKRYHNPDSFQYLHPIMKEQLEETFGVMVYQEDVLKICYHFAGLDLADADVLRRIMSGKPRFKDEFQRIINRFFDNCRQRGYPDELTKEVWRQIRSFAGYSFSKAHSASYAVESYQSLYLKAHFPVEFITAVINNFGGFYRTWVYFNEAKRLGANIHLPCLNHSGYLTTVMQNTIFIGFVHIENLETKLVNRIIAEREQNGKFKGINDAIERCAIPREQLQILIRCGAFSFTEKTKPCLLWEATMRQNKKEKKSIPSPRLFSPPENDYKLPDFKSLPIEDAFDEIELLGFPVTLSFFDLLKTKFRGEIVAKDMINYVGKSVRMVGELANLKYVWTSKKELMHFGCFIDVNGIFFDTVHFPNSLKQYPFRGHGIYLLKGKIEQEFGHPNMNVEKMAKLPIQPDPRFV